MITLRTDILEAVRLVAGYDTVAELARAMGLDRTTVSRTLAGKLEISASFIVGMSRAFPKLTTDHLFDLHAEQLSA